MPDTRTRMLLIVDNPDDRKQIVEMLSQSRTSPFEVDWAESLASGLECLTKESYAAVLVDLNLPDSEYLTAFLKLQDVVGSIPVLALTGIVNESLGLRIIGESQQVLLNGDVESSALPRVVAHAIDRRNPEEKLQAIKRQHERLFDSSLDLLCITDLNGSIQRINPSFRRVLGYTEDELVNRPLIKFVHPEDREATRAQVRRLTTGVGTAQFTNRCRAKDGLYRWLEWSCPAVGEGATEIYAVARDVTERKQMEEVLRESETRLRVITDSVPMWISYVDNDQRYQFVNVPYEQFYGVPREQILGRQVHELLDAETYSYARPYIEAVLRAEPQQFEKQRVNENGPPSHYLVNYVPDADADGHVRGFFALITDVSPIKQAQQDLVESEEQFRNLAENSPLVVSIYRGTKCLYTNRAAEELTEYSREELLQMDSVEMIHPDDRDMVLERSLRRQAGEPTPARYEFRLMTKTGKVRWIDFSAVMINYGGQPAVLSSCIDITDRRVAEERLRASERRYRSVVEASAEAIVSLTPDGVVRTWNPAAERMFGYSMDEMVGERISRLAPLDREGEVDRLFARIRKAQPIVEYETQRRTKDGRLLDVVLNIRPIVDEAGNVKGASAAARDMTAYKQALEKVRNRDAELAHISRVTTMGEMATTLAHELTQPLASAGNYAGGCIELIKSGNIRPTDLLNPLRSLIDQINECGEIIGRLQSFVSKAAPKKCRLNLNELAREVHTFMPNGGLDQQITRRLDLDANLPNARGDPVQVKQVLVNLIRNAVEAMATSRGEVVVRTLVTDGMPTVMVIDQGIGIPAADFGRVFEPYFTTKVDGMGLGLSICHTIIQNHGGRIWAEPNPQGGARFCFVLPPANETPKETTSPDRPVSGNMTNPPG